MSNPLKLSFKSESLIILLLLISIAASFWFYQQMPAQVPIHWGINGQADGWGSREFAAFFFPALIVGMYLLLILIPFLDPKKERYAEFTKAYWAIRFLLVLFLIYIYFISSLIGIGYNISISKSIAAGMGVLYLVMGNYLGKIRPNWFVGIRTPWTMSSEEVWTKTHRLGGKLFVLAGFLCILGIILPSAWAFILIVGSVLLAALITVVYSYIIYKKLPKNSEKQQ